MKPELDENCLQPRDPRDGDDQPQATEKRRTKQRQGWKSGKTTGPGETRCSALSARLCYYGTRRSSRRAIAVCSPHPSHQAISVAIDAVLLLPLSNCIRLEQNVTTESRFAGYKLN